MQAIALGEALSIAEAAATVREAAATLRQRFAPLRVVVVDAFDMRDETPAAIGLRCRLYLGASDGHCWTVTHEPAAASGLFICEAGR